MMSFSTTQTTLNSQTIGILNANSLHFIPISLLFLPFIFSAHSIVQLYFSSSVTDVVNSFEPFNLLLLKTLIANYENQLTLITLVALIFFVILPTVAGVALITYSTNEAIQGRTLTFSSTFKSLSHSYIPLLSTTISGSIQLILIFLFITLSPIAITKSVKAYGFHFGPFILSIFINTMASYVLVFTILYFIGIWGIAPAIAVLESKSGFTPLQQSAKRSKEFRSHSFFIVFATGLLIISSLSYSAVTKDIGSPTKWIMVFQVFVIYLQSSLMILYYVVANTVLYVQCKEDDPNTSVDVYEEYVKVVVNEKDDENTHDVAKENTSRGFSYMMYLLLIVWVALSYLMIFQDL